MGWVLRRRDHGGVIFIDLRDRYGITQIVFNPESGPAVHAKAHQLRSEWVLAVQGTVTLRPGDMANPKLATGGIEILARELRILNTSETPPFPLDEDIEVSDTLRLQYRYLDLRRPEMAANLITRHKAVQTIRTYLNDNGFLDIETPMLTRSTPEGARDYLVPSRVNAGRFYALPQSPQLFKQLLMIAGMERYYQIVKCFRDEDLRADRQPEFTQIDMELSFVNEEQIIKVTEGMIALLFKETRGLDVAPPFKRITFDQAMARFGTDRPDMRFGFEIVDLTGIASGCGFKVFREIADKGGIVRAINAKNCAGFSRKDLDDLTEFAVQLGAKGLAWVKVKADGEWQSPIAKFFSDEERAAIAGALDAVEGDLLFLHPPLRFCEFLLEVFYGRFPDFHLRMERSDPRSPLFKRERRNEKRAPDRTLDPQIPEVIGNQKGVRDNTRKAHKDQRIAASPNLPPGRKEEAAHHNQKQIGGNGHLYSGP